MSSRDTTNMDRDQIKQMSDDARSALNADPITGEPGAHPIGTGVGAAGGAATGAAIGSVAGPIGTLIGGAIGAVVGGLAGKAAGEAIDPTMEEAYWREAHVSTPYYQAGHEYDRDYKNAYQLGYETRTRYPATTRFEDVENDLANSWETIKGESRLKWEEAKMATRDAWNRTNGVMHRDYVVESDGDVEKSHPIGVGVGASGGAVAGAALG